ncbi:MAG: FKBP-type peptidyl-prolyl cis-trans isomerase [Candidatus Nanoarchaeia archaeon]|nr:FKBP-type peptidyl-prolyl cis-trans isomerase [Candidatus Nanoarchaeia archaeon]
MKTKKGDFIELDFVGRIKETNEIFDLTSESIAKKENIFRKGFNYRPWIVCIGEGDVIKGLDKELEGKEINKNYSIYLDPEDAFGKRDSKLLQLVNTAKFRQQKIMPYPGLQLNIDGLIGTVKSVSGSRTLIDFNNPLSGKDIIYEFKINKVIGDDIEKLKKFFDFHFNQQIEVEKKEDKFLIKKFKIADPFKEIIKTRLERLLGKKVEYAL